MTCCRWYPCGTECLSATRQWQHSTTKSTGLTDNLRIYFSLDSNYGQNPNQVVKASAEKEIFAGVVPLNNTNTTLVALQDNDGLGHILLQAAIGDLPDTNGAIFGAGSNDVVIERAPLEVQHRSFVSANLWVVLVDAAELEKPK